MGRDPTPDVVATTLKHLNVRRDNFYRSLRMIHEDDDEARGKYNAEIEALNDAISFFEHLREQRRLADSA